MASPTEKNHNKHLDLLQDYKIHLIKYIEELQRLDKQSEFAKKWNEATIKERKKEVQIIDKIIKMIHHQTRQSPCLRGIHEIHD